MANFHLAYNLVLDHEGGYQNNPNDSGNYNSLGQLVGTNWGISAPVYESFLGYPPSKFDVQNMSLNEAKAIYKERFWDDILGDQIRDQQVANIFFDGRVNHGRTGVKIMQRILGVADDGVVGSLTLNEINYANPRWLFESYQEERRDFYYWLVENNGSLQVFLNGWLNRIDSFQYTGENASIGIGSGLAVAAIMLGFWISRAH